MIVGRLEKGAIQKILTAFKAQGFEISKNIVETDLRNRTFSADLSLRATRKDSDMLDLVESIMRTKQVSSLEFVRPSDETLLEIRNSE